MSNHYKHILIEDKAHVVAVNPHTILPGEENDPFYLAFDKANPPIVWYGPAFDGTKTDEEIEKFLEYSSFGNTWVECSERFAKNVLSQVRQAAQPKEVEQVKDGCQTCKKYDNPFCSNSYHVVNQPVQQEEPEQFYCRNISGGTQPKCDSQCHTCKKAVQYRQNETQLLLASKFIKDIHPSTPIVSEGEEREEKIDFGDSFITLKRGHIWFDEYDFGVEARFLKDLYEAYCLFNGNPFDDLKSLSPNREEGRELQSEINKKAYAELIEQDVEAINKYLPESSLEKDHIKLVLFKSIDWLYSPSSTPLEQKELKDGLTDEEYAECATLLGWGPTFYSFEKRVELGKEKVHNTFIENKHDLATYRIGEPDSVERIWRAIRPHKIIACYRYLESKGYKI